MRKLKRSLAVIMASTSLFGRCGASGSRYASVTEGETSIARKVVRRGTPIMGVGMIGYLLYLIDQEAKKNKSMPSEKQIVSGKSSPLRKSDSFENHGDNTQKSSSSSGAGESDKRKTVADIINNLEETKELFSCGKGKFKFANFVRQVMKRNVAENFGMGANDYSTYGNKSDIKEFSKFCDCELLRVVKENFDSEEDLGSGAFKFYFGKFDDNDAHHVAGNSYDDYREFAGDVVCLFMSGSDRVFCHLENNDMSESGWKLHVTPDLFHCAEVFDIVFELYKEKKINFKFVRGLDMYRKKLAKSKTQAGKFITIYPRSDNEARWIADELSRRFSECGLDESCFLKVRNDFKVSTGIYTRISKYAGEDKDYLARNYCCMPYGMLKKHYRCDYEGLKLCRHPFDNLYHDGVAMPRNILDMANKVHAKLPQDIREKCEKA